MALGKEGGREGGKEGEVKGEKLHVQGEREEGGMAGPRSPISPPIDR
jgi:hypothetical protein